MNGKLLLLIAAVKGDPYLMEQIEANRPEFAESPRQWWQNSVNREESSSQEQGATEPVSEALSDPASETAASLGEAPANPWYAAPAAPPYNAPVAPTYEPPAAGHYETITIPTEPPAGTARRPFYYPTEASPGHR